MVEAFPMAEFYCSPQEVIYVEADVTQMFFRAAFAEVSTWCIKTQSREDAERCLQPHVPSPEILASWRPCVLALKSELLRTFSA